MAATAQNGDIMVGSVRNMVDRLSKDFSASKPPMSIHEPRKSHLAKPSNPLVVVTFPYKATQEDELTLRVGDVVEVLEEVEDGWSRGRVQQSGDVGMFPTNFVESQKGSSSVSPPLSNASSAPSSTAPAAAPCTNPPSSSRGDDVILRRADDKPEAIRRTPSVIGSVASGNPAVSSTVTTFSVTSKSDMKTKEMARVKFTYTPEHPDELRLGEIGALVEIIRKECGDAGWFEGELNGKTGLFPDNFVELIQVPAGTTSGMPKAGSSAPSAPNASSMGAGAKPSKTPIVAPAGAVAVPPAVPAKPLKPKLSDSTTSLNSGATGPPVNTSTKPTVSSNFAEIQRKLHLGLKVVGPGDAIPPLLTKSSIVASSNSEPAGPMMGRPLSTMETHSDDFTEQPGKLTHVIKDRPRAPGKRPMSMMMLKKKSSTENLLESPSSEPGSNSFNVNTLPVSPSTATPSAVSVSTGSPTRSVAMRPAYTTTTGESSYSASTSSSSLKKTDEPVRSNTSAANHQTTSNYTPSYSQKLSATASSTNTTSSTASSHSPSSASSKPSASVISNSSLPSVAAGPNGDAGDYVSRKDYNELLAKVLSLESRLAALESK